MKSKIYTFIFIVCLASGLLKAQTNTILYNGFNNYNGFPATVAPGWYYSNNDTGATTKTFYNTVGFFGVDSPAYKFGIDMVTIISPAFGAADSLRFWMKGNGTPKDSNYFEIYSSVDSSNWTLLSSMDSITTAAQIIELPLTNADKFVKFYYRKIVSGFNVGLDDIAVLKNSGVGITEIKTINDIRIFPAPTTGLVNILLPSVKLPEISIYDLIGNKLNNISISKTGDKKITLDLTGRKPGFYFIRIKTGDGLVTKRITLQ